MNSVAFPNLDSISSTERNKLEAYLEKCSTAQDMQPMRLEDVDESSLQCLLQCIRGNCTFDKIGDLFHDVGVLASSDALDDNSTNIMHTSNKIRSTDMSYSSFAQQTPASYHSSKQSSDSQSLYNQLYASRFTAEKVSSTLTNTPATSNTISPMALEEWQMKILEKLEHQQAAILKCQAQMDALAQLMTALLDVSNQKMNGTNASDKHTVLAATLQNHPTSMPPTPKPMISSLMEIWISRFVLIPRTITTFLQSLRLVRFIKQIKKEATRHNVQWVHFPLVFKILFACFIMHTRMKAFDAVSTASIQDGHFLSFWNLYRIHIFVMISVGIYFVKTRIAFFWYRVLLQEDLLGRIWRDEDLNEQTNTPQFQRDDGNNTRTDQGIRRGQRDRNDGDEVKRQNGIIRDGRVGMTQAHRENARPDPLDQRRDINLRNNMAPLMNWRVFSLTQLRQGFLGGNIRRRDPPGRGQQGRNPIVRYKEILGDCAYLIGSFFLSLFPMWQPRAQPETEDQSEDDE